MNSFFITMYSINDLGILYGSLGTLNEKFILINEILIANHIFKVSSQKKDT